MNFGKKHKVHIESGMSTLSDIIFMLLIFFIIASASAVQNLSAEIEKPSAATGKENPAKISVAITKDLAYTLNNNATTKDAIVSQLEQELAASTDKRVILLVDRNVPTGETIELFSAIQNIGGTPFIATEKAK
jgi:biopolymer transport protein ExbD